MIEMFTVVMKTVFKIVHISNPLSPNTDQDQISPNNIHTLSRDVLSINKMITQEKMP